ncbi:MAG: GNAT family protein [Methanothrix sp.]
MLSIKSEKLGIALIMPQYDHARALTEIANSKDIAENVGSIGEFPYPYTEKDAFEMIDSAISAYSLGISYNFEVIPKDVDSPVGMVGIRNVNMHALSAEMGFWTGEKYRGRGYTKAALSMLIGFCFSKLGLVRVYATALKSNSKSIALMESLGMKQEGILRNAAITNAGPKDQVMLSILNGEFKPKLDLVFDE